MRAASAAGLMSSVRCARKVKGRTRIGWYLGNATPMTSSTLSSKKPAVFRYRNRQLLSVDVGAAGTETQMVELASDPMHGPETLQPLALRFYIDGAGHIADYEIN